MFTEDFGVGWVVCDEQLEKCKDSWKNFLIDFFTIELENLEEIYMDFKFLLNYLWFLEKNETLWAVAVDLSDDLYKCIIEFQYFLFFTFLCLIVLDHAGFTLNYFMG